MIAEAGEAGISVDKMVEITTQDEIDSSLKWEMESTSTQTAGAFQSVSSPSFAEDHHASSLLRPTATSLLMRRCCSGDAAHAG